MIASLQGVLEYKDGSSAVINVGGVGYLCHMSTNSLLGLGKIGNTVRVNTLMQVRADAITLYGFTSTEEQSLFESLVSVSGVGAKFALSILSTYSPTELTQILQANDAKSLTAVSGIGKKTAQRIILELQGSLDLLTGFIRIETAESGSPEAEAVLALEAMGFSRDEISLALEGDADNSTEENSDPSSMIRQALKRLG